MTQIMSYLEHCSVEISTNSWNPQKYHHAVPSSHRAELICTTTWETKINDGKHFNSQDQPYQSGKNKGIIDPLTGHRQNMTLSWL